MALILKLIFITLQLFIICGNCTVKKFTDLKIIEHFGARGLEFPSDIIEDSLLTVDQLITKYNYQSEIHYVTTADGYILRLDRILPQNTTMKQSQSQPVLLQHGLTDSAAGFIVMGPKISLGYMLADLGYDVWLSNSRGTRYSRNHTNLNPDRDMEFWDFSWHEMGIYDLPTTIDYILNLTKYPKLHYIGHSQGCTSFFVMCSMKPEYNDKILTMQALAPAIYLKHMRTSHLTLLNLFFLTLNPIREMAEGKNRPFCLNSKENEQFCFEFMNLMFGKNIPEFNQTMFPVILSHLPAGCSGKQIKHFLQLIKSEQFQQYNYGIRDNKKHYNGAHHPPKYNLNNIEVPIALYYSMNDLLTDYQDIQLLYTKLRQPIQLYRIPMYHFNHMDYLFGIHVRSLLYNNIVEILHKYDLKH